MASRANELLGLGAESITPTTAGPTLKRHKPLGIVGGAFDIVQRPARAISEVAGAAHAGEEDLLSAAWRGLSGEYRYPTLGYQLFPEAQEKGFQPLDLAAFAADVLADPLTWAGPGIAKAVGKPMAKGAIAFGGKLSPKITKILPEVEKALTPAGNRKLLYGEMEALGFGKKGYESLMKRMEIAAPRQEIKDLFKVVRARKYEKGVKPKEIWYHGSDARGEKLINKQGYLAEPAWITSDIGLAEKFATRMRNTGKGGKIYAIDRADFTEAMEDALENAPHLEGVLNLSGPSSKVPLLDPSVYIPKSMKHLAPNIRGKIPKIVVKGTKDRAFRSMLKSNPWLVDEMRQQLRFMHANDNIEATTALQSLGRSIGTGMMPIVKSLKRFAGGPGKKAAEGLERAQNITRLEVEKFYPRLAEAFSGLSEKELIQSVRYREMGETIRPMISDKAAEAAKKWGAALDEMRDELLAVRDPLGNELRVWNPMGGRIGKWEPFSEHVQSGYYPRVYSKEFYAKGGQQSLYKMYRAAGKSHAEAEGLARRLAHRPRRVGHIEMVRTGNEIGYELNPAKTLPKYFYDALLRKNLAKEFGVNNEILDVAIADLTKAGFTKSYTDAIMQVVTGKNIHDQAWEKLATYITSFQALSKLGFNTSAANLGQGPMNQWVRSGLGNTLRSIQKVAAGEKGELGAAAFMRASRGDIVRGMLGGKSKWTDWYMKWIGFESSEKLGRYMGAIGGDLEAKTLARKWFQNVGEAAVGNKKALKEAGRLESELMRKYKIPASVIDDTGKIPEVVNIGGRQRRLLDEAAIMAADKTMHAFFPWELPPGWRSPFWRTALQFKSFIYKQTEFMMTDVVGPGLQWFATDGAKGDVMPLLRTLFAMPIGAEAVTHLRDVVKSAPAHVLSLLRDGKFSDRKYKEFFLDADNPTNRLLSDLTYVGTFGLLGDAVDSAQEGRLWKWAVGPTISDVIEGAESIPRGKVGEFATRQLPGALGIPYGTDAFEWGKKQLAPRRKLQ